jgi:hypothetical protein
MLLRWWSRFSLLAENYEITDIFGQYALPAGSGVVVRLASLVLYYYTALSWIEQDW